MKIIIVGENNYESNKYGSFPFYTKPDSTLIKGNKPFFIPDFTSECVFTTHLVARISRLGKSIPQRFACRYYDAVTVGVNFTAKDVQEKMKAEGQPWTLATDFDSSSVIGSFMQMNDVSIEKKVCRIEMNNEVIMKKELTDIGNIIEKGIAQLSTFFILRQGDLLFSGPLHKPIKVDEGFHLSGFLDNYNLLEFNVK